MKPATLSDYDSYYGLYRSHHEHQRDRYYKLEGYLFPDTYQFFENEYGRIDPSTASSITLRISSPTKCSDDIAEIRLYARIEIITLASIIQAEAANTDDMYMISAILRNRLENGAEHDIHTLDCDSTVYYPYKTANDAPEGFVSSYSTYDNSGLLRQARSATRVLKLLRRQSIRPKRAASITSSAMTVMAPRTMLPQWTSI